MGMGLNEPVLGIPTVKSIDCEWEFNPNLKTNDGDIRRLKSGAWAI